MIGEDENSMQAEFSDDQDDFDEDQIPFLTHRPLQSLQYPTLKALRTDLQRMASTLGFAVATTSSDSRRAYFTCIYGGSYRDRRPLREQLVRQRPAHTYKKNCPFALKATSESESSCDWTFETLHNEHNHPHSASLNIAKLRQESITPEIRQFLYNEIDNRVKPSQLLLNLSKAFPNVKLLAGDINRLTYRRRASVRTGHTATEACINKLRENNELHRAFMSDTQELIGLVYTVPTARALLRRFPTVIFLDCTYKTNRYGLPMLHIAGFTSTNQTYTAGVAFLLRETTSWYSYALSAFLDLVDPIRQLPIRVVITDREEALANALQIHLPQAYILNCLWHLGENIKSSCKASFLHHEDWQDRLSTFRGRFMSQVAGAKSEECLNAAMAAMKADYSEPEYEKAMTYIGGLLEIKERFVAAWANQHPHLNQHSTSRLEGNHRAVKQAIGVNNGDLFHVIDALRDYLQHQWTHIQSKISIQRTRSPLAATRFFDKVSLP